MAVVLLGAGTSISKATVPETNNTLTANAVVNTTCMHLPWHREWSDGWRTYYVDYCALCGTEFSRGSKALPPFNPYPTNPFPLLNGESILG